MKYSQQRKSAIESKVTDALKAATGGRVALAVAGLLIDRAWIMSFATGEPWMPVGTEHLARAKQLHRLLAPSGGSSLVSTDTVLMPTISSIVAPTFSRGVTRWIEESSEAGDEMYVRSVRLFERYVAGKILDYDVSYMWATERVFQKLSALDILLKRVDRASLANIAITVPDVSIGAAFRAWEAAYQVVIAAIASGRKIDQSTSEIAALTKTTSTLHDVLTNAVFALAYGGQSLSDCAIVTAVGESAFDPQIHEKSEPLGELGRMYPKTFALSTEGSLLEAPIFSTAGYMVKPDELHAIRRRLMIGIVSQPEWLTYWFTDQELALAYPTLTMLAMASPDRSAFFLCDPVDHVGDAQYRAEGREVLSPYTMGSKLLTRTEAALLGRLCHSKSNNQMVYPINPTFPASLALKGESEKPTLTPVNGFKYSRKLFPTDFMDHSASLDPALASATREVPNFTGRAIALDFIVDAQDTPNEINADGAFHQVTVSTDDDRTARDLHGYYVRYAARLDADVPLLRCTYLYVQTDAKRGNTKRRRNKGTTEGRT